MRSAREGADALRRALRAEGGTVAEMLAGGVARLDGYDNPGPAQLAACGPRVRGHEHEYELLLEMILEGSRLHYGQPMVVHAMDSDLALLLGDQLYALGLARLAALGDLEAVSELADMISLVAQAHAASDSDLADAACEAGAVAVGWGSTPAHEAAKTLARDQDARAPGALRAAARRRLAANGG